MRKVITLKLEVYNTKQQEQCLILAIKDIVAGKEHSLTQTQHFPDPEQDRDYGYYLEVRVVK